MQNFVFLAHGALGPVDEIAAVVVAIAAAIFVVLGFVNRKPAPGTSITNGTNATSSLDADAPDKAPDHYRLD